MTALLAAASPAPARPRTPMFDGPALTDIRHAIEAAYPGWHVWMSDAGHPWATHLTHGGGVTLDAPAIGLMAHVIARYEHGESFVAVRGMGSAA